MPCGYGTLRTTSVRIRHQVSCRAWTEVTAALKVSCSSSQRSRLHQNLTLQNVKYQNILNSPPSLQVLSGPPGNALLESESTLLRSRGVWENLEVLQRTGEVDRSVWDVWVWHPDWFTFGWCGLSMNWDLKEWNRTLRNKVLRCLYHLIDLLYILTITAQRASHIF